MEELILLYYLRIISLLIIIVTSYLCYLFFIKDIKLVDLSINIEKNQRVKNIIHSNISNLNSIEKTITAMYLSIHSKYINNIHFGKFIFPEEINLKEFLFIITKPSNFVDKITIVEGWSIDQLNDLLKIKFTKFKDIDYSLILADTYYLHSYEDFNDFFQS